MAADFFKLRGQVSDGMFPNEATVVMTDHLGVHVVALVPRALLDSQGRIRVRRVGHTEGLSLVKVPGELIRGSSSLYVSDSELTPA